MTKKIQRKTVEVKHYACTKCGDEWTTKLEAENCFDSHFLEYHCSICGTKHLLEEGTDSGEGGEIVEINTHKNGVLTNFICFSCLDKLEEVEIL